MQVSDVATLGLDELLAALEAKVAGEDPALVTGDQAAARVKTYARIEKVAAGGRTLYAQRVAVTRAWEGEGHQTCADWMASQAGSSVSEAQDMIKTSLRLQDLPATQAAVRSGTLSPQQARVVSDAAAADPSAERRLLATAGRETFKELRAEGQRVKAAACDESQRRARIYAERSMRNWIDDGGAGNLLVRGKPCDIARILHQVKPHQEAVFRQARSTGVRETYENRSYDAFMAMIDRLEAGDVARSAGSPQPIETTGTPASAKAAALSDDPAPPHDAVDAVALPLFEPPAVAGPAVTASERDPAQAELVGGPAPPPKGRSNGRLPGGSNVKIIVHVSYDALLRGRTEPGDLCDIDDLGPIDLDDVRALWAGAFIAAFAERGKDVTVAHLGRGLNALQRTAMEAKRIRCTNIACNQTIAIQMDHRYPWTKDQVTQLDNMNGLCDHDHYLKTHHGWSLEPGVGRRRFLPPLNP